MFKSEDSRMLDVAINLAVQAHAGTPDKGGNPYILHPLHLMNQFLYDDALATIAVLHDAVEDSDLTLEQLRAGGFSWRVVDAIDALTHSRGESYEHYIERICQNVDAIKVKRKDLRHNLDVTRLRSLEPKDEARVQKYHMAFMRLTEAKRSFGKHY